MDDESPSPLVNMPSPELIDQPPPENNLFTSEEFILNFNKIK